MKGSFNSALITVTLQAGNLMVPLESYEASLVFTSLKSQRAMASMLKMNWLLFCQPQRKQMKHNNRIEYAPPGRGAGPRCRSAAHAGR